MQPLPPGMQSMAPRETVGNVPCNWNLIRAPRTMKEEGQTLQHPNRLTVQAKTSPAHPSAPEAQVLKSEKNLKGAGRAS